MTIQIITKFYPKGLPGDEYPHWVAGSADGKFELASGQTEREAKEAFVWKAFCKVTGRSQWPVSDFWTTDAMLEAIEARNGQ